MKSRASATIMHIYMPPLGLAHLYLSSSSFLVIWKLFDFPVWLLIRMFLIFLGVIVREREILDAAIDNNHEVSTPFLLTNTAVKRKVPNFWGKYYNTKWRPLRFLIALVRRNKMETHEWPNLCLKSILFLPRIVPHSFRHDSMAEKFLLLQAFDSFLDALLDGDEFNA